MSLKSRHLILLGKLWERALNGESANSKDLASLIFEVLKGMWQALEL